MKRLFSPLAAMSLVTLCLMTAPGSSAMAQAQGKLSFSPAAGAVGTQVSATASGLPVGTDLELVWASADASWNVADGRFYGVEAEETRTVLAHARADDSGNADFTFTVPDDYGYVHNVFLEAGDAEVARQGFTVVPELTISPTSGPPGTPVTVTVTGIGYSFWQSVWHLLYDGAHTGWLSAISSKGTATAVIPATGAEGRHTLQILSGTHPVPYLNQQQSPNYNPQIPTVLSALFEITSGEPVMPDAAETQVLPRTSGKDPDASGPSLTSDFTSGTVGSLITLSGSGFPADAEVNLSWSTVRGNRLSGQGWEESESVLGTVTSDAEGNFDYVLPTPDDLGGEHKLTATVDETSATLGYTVTPSVSFHTEQPVAPGEEITVTLKGVGWTETANIYTLVMDNGYLGYGCGFNSQGDVTIHLTAPGQAGMHYLSIYPSIYQGTLTGPGAPPDTATANATYLQIPMLNWQDHPGEELPAFQLAFEVGP